MPADDRSAGFGEFVLAAHRRGKLVVQPRMGFSDPATMRRGLLATRHAGPTTVGTLTLDSFTRTGRHDDARACLAGGIELNGYPIVAHGAATTAAVLDGVAGGSFPVQVRHGCAQPEEIIDVLLRAGLDATEGGPVSYCLPYGRTPLRESVRSWQRCCDLLAAHRPAAAHPPAEVHRPAAARRPHLETFGGCLMGQLCPPSLLVAVSVLEALFFRHHGIDDISLSYAQQTHPVQDEEALHALRRLAGELLAGVSWHIVVYTYMGVFPRTPAGARLLGAQAARLAVRAGAARLIVKTAAEAYRIPSIEENVAALREAAAAAEDAVPAPGTPEAGAARDSQTYAEARALVDEVRQLHADPGRALLLAFERGVLDVPFCLHPDNRGRSRAYLDAAGWLRWSELGALPLRGIAEPGRASPLTSAELLDSLHHVQRTFDRAASDPTRAPAPIG